MTQGPKAFIAIAILAACLAAAVPARAETPPAPGRKADALKSLEARIEREDAGRKALAREMEKIESSLDETRKKLVSVADRMRESERLVKSLESRIALMAQEETALTARLESDYGSIAELIVALERMRRVPPESVLAKPGAPLEVAQSAMLLHRMLPSVHKRAEILARDLKRLEAVRKELARDRSAALAARDRLESERRDVASLAAEREKLFRATQSDYRERENAVKRMAAEAASLRELMARLEAEAEKEREQERREAAKRKDSDSKTASRRRAVPVPPAGQARLPASGMIVVGYGETDHIGAESQGLTIETGAGSVIVSPFGGVVKFAGAFKNYGQMVIIEHEKKFHSLIAGMQRIDVSVGQAVNAGEPLGVMPDASSSQTEPALYYELRRDGKPVDPVVKFANLRS